MSFFYIKILYMIGSDFLLETPTEQLLAIARRFKKLRLEANVRQSDLATRSGVGIATIRRFEAGGNISLLNLARLMTYLGYPMNPAGVVPEFDAVTLDEFTQPARKRAR
jgi:transcriptional regulator with XRE-family HTH domain